MRLPLPFLSLSALLVMTSACGSDPAKAPVRRDPHSFSNPEQVRVRHLELDVEVSFERKVLSGTATLNLERRDRGAQLVLDTRDLRISAVEAGTGKEFAAAPFAVGDADRILGAPLTVDLPGDATKVRIRYETSPHASALQWLDAAQTAGKQHPFLYTQSQAIHARSWIPLQDTPGVRMTYAARIRTPKELWSVMGSRHDFRLADPKEPLSGDFNFRMPNPIPSYLVALAVGNLERREMSTRTAVFAEPEIAPKAAREFEDTERMIKAAEGLYGPYRWLRYDILVLPPSFPFGGMENPLLTFATPTVLAGDKSLVSLVAHELAHSWSGNLVTNATWRDFWLNEGFTVYVERRIQEVVYGEARARMEAVLGLQELEEDLAKLPPGDQVLHIDLAGRDPDDAVTSVAYEKGALFLTAIEQVFGRERFDAFLRGYFDHFAFQSITTEQFTAYLKEKLFALDGAAAAQIPLEEWLTQPGLPVSAPRPVSDAFEPVDAAAAAWLAGQPPSGGFGEWNTHQWLHFLRAFSGKADRATLAALDRRFRLTQAGNSEILQQWLLLAVQAGYEPAYPKVEEFLRSVGRRKFLKPLYEELVKTTEGKRRAQAIYAKARPGYHPIATTTIDSIVGAP
ncbi:MAG: M1 family metallopeptidase [Bryobacterales bacterium]|nr:M1 family metallopeptidase [Bryobacterales bacterium]